MAVSEQMQEIRVHKIPPAEFHALLETGRYQLLDVRPLEFRRDTSFISGSRHCPLVYLAQRYAQLPRERPLLLADWAMKQSTTAAVYLTAQGYHVEGVLKGGLERWKGEGLPVEHRNPEDALDELVQQPAQ